MADKLIEASGVIIAICSELDYSRSHVAKILRDNAVVLKAESQGRRWMLPARSVRLLRSLVKKQSGPRYKVGERGPNRDRQAA